MHVYSYWLVVLAAVLIIGHILFAYLLGCLEEPGPGSSWALLQMYESDGFVLFMGWIITCFGSIVASVYAASWAGAIVALLVYAMLYGGLLLIERRKSRKHAPS